MSLFQQQREQVGQMILDLSIELFRKKGYEATTIDEITRSIGIAKGTFYNFYASKRDILMHWAVQIYQKLDYRRTLDRSRTFLQNMEEMVDILSESIIAEEALFVSFLKELIGSYGNPEKEEEYDFDRIFALIAENSADRETVCSSGREMKLGILSDSLFHGILRWFDQGRPAGMIGPYLKDIVFLCLNGILYSKEEPL